MRFLIWFTVLMVWPVQADPQQLDKLVAQWVQLAQQQNALQTQWQQRQGILRQQLALLEAEHRELSALVQQDDVSSDEISQQRLALTEQQTQLEAQQQVVASGLSQTEKLIQRLLPQLPPPLKQQWDKELAALADKDSHSEKLEQHLNMLATLQRFNQRLAVQEADMQLVDGQKMRVQQVYLGTSLGWYVSQDGKYWGQGISTPAGWQWQAQSPTVKPEIIQALLTSMRNASQASLIELPYQMPDKS